MWLKTMLFKKPFLIHQLQKQTILILKTKYKADKAELEKNIAGLNDLVKKTKLTE